MSRFSISIKSFGERAILIEWPVEVCNHILNDILAFEKKLKKIHKKDTEFVVAYNSLTIIYYAQIDFLIEQDKLLQEYNTSDTDIRISSKQWKIPVCYDGDFGIDLEEVCQKLKLSKSELITLHTASVYNVYGIGFLPGFMYLGGLPAELEISRRATPRLNVKKGSVGLAGKQTGIYPQESPGGWNIIGNCPIPIFDGSKQDPCFVSVGDKVQFYKVSKSEYDLMKIEVEVGIFNPKNLENA